MNERRYWQNKLKQLNEEGERWICHACGESCLLGVEDFGIGHYDGMGGGANTDYLLVSACCGDWFDEKIVTIR